MPGTYADYIWESEHDCLLNHHKAAAFFDEELLQLYEESIRAREDFNDLNYIRKCHYAVVDLILSGSPDINQQFKTLLVKLGFMRDDSIKPTTKYVCKM